MNLFQLRYKLFRAASRLFLGPLYGDAIGVNLTRDLDEASMKPRVAESILSRHPISEAVIQPYSFPADFPVVFPRSAAFDAKIGYLLKNVAISPHEGLMWLPGVTVFQQSIGSVPRYYHAMQNALQPVSMLSVNTPVVPFANVSYYHVLIESLAQVLHARKRFPNTSVLMEKNHFRYLDAILDFLDIPSSSRILVEQPVMVPKGVLIPRWVNGGYNLPCDLSILREAILPRIPPSKGMEKIYISRAHTKSRPLERETELEIELQKQGFSICYFESLPLAEQFSRIHHASVIVAPHGAGLANLIAARPGTKIHEILSPNWFNTCYAKMAVQLGMSYSYSITLPHPSGQYAINVEDVLQTISRLD